MAIGDKEKSLRQGVADAELKQALSVDFKSWLTVFSLIRTFSLETISDEHFRVETVPLIQKILLSKTNNFEYGSPSFHKLNEVVLPNGEETIFQQIIEVVSRLNTEGMSLEQRFATRVAALFSEIGRATNQESADILNAFFDWLLEDGARRGPYELKELCESTRQIILELVQMRHSDHDDSFRTVHPFTSFEAEAIAFENATPDQLEIPIERAVSSMSMFEVVEIVKKSIGIEGKYAYFHSISQWKNRRRLAAIAALSGSCIEVKWDDDHKKIEHATLLSSSQSHDFIYLRRIVEIIVDNNELNDAEFANRIDEIAELFDQTLVGKSLHRASKSDNSTTVFDHMIDYLRRVKTDGLTDDSGRERLALRLSFLHDIAKCMFRPPFFVWENGTLVRVNDEELIAQLTKDELDDHGLLSALYFSALWDDVRKNVAQEELEAGGKYELFDEPLERLVTRMFRLHQVAAQLDKGSKANTPHLGLQERDVHELFEFDASFEYQVLSLVTAMTAFDSSSVAEHSDNLKHTKFEAMNPILVLNVLQQVIDSIDHFEVEAQNVIEYLFSIVATNISLAIQKLEQAGSEAQLILDELKIFIKEKAPHAYLNLLPESATAI